MLDVKKEFWDRNEVLHKGQGKKSWQKEDQIFWEYMDKTRHWLTIKGEDTEKILLSMLQ